MVPRTIRPYGWIVFFGGNMEELLLFFMTFLLVLCLYEIFIVRRHRKDDSKNKKKKINDPFEIVYLERKYRLDMDKVPYNQLLQLVALTSSLDIAIIVSIIVRIESFFVKMLSGFICTICLIVVSYHLIYLFYKKKGMIKK